jgi:hypothetical protein
MPIVLLAGRPRRRTKREKERNVFKNENLIRISISRSVQEKKAKIKSSRPKRKIQKVHRYGRNSVKTFQQKLFNILFRHEKKKKNVSREFVTEGIY